MVRKQVIKKNPDSHIEIRPASEEPPPLGLIVNNPLLEYLLDRRFIAYGRFVLVYGKKSSSKTSLFFDWAKIFQSVGGDVLWIETEHAADLTYAAKQGVDLARLSIVHPSSLEEGLGVAEAAIRNMPKAYPDGNTPVLVGYDSIAGSTTEYELDPSHSFSDTQPGLHARLISRFYRELEESLANEKCVFMVMNQLRNKIGGFGFGEDSADALIGGEAQFNHSSVHLKMIKIAELTAPIGEDKVERKVGSVHKIQCKRNKLGREGKNQEVEVDLWIDGGIDWWSSLVRHLGKKGYGSVLNKKGGYYYWGVANTVYIDPATKKEVVIDLEQSYRESELGLIIKYSPAAQEAVRKAFVIPGLPQKEEEEKIEEIRKKKRKSNKPEEVDPLIKRLTILAEA